MLWDVEAADLVAEGRQLTELSGVGPSIAKRIRGWLDDPPGDLEPPDIRRGFLTTTAARRILAREPTWQPSQRGDLQMHTTYSDGSSPVAAMAKAGIEMGYDYIAVTDHSKGLPIAKGMDETRLAAQGREVREVNEVLGGEFTVLHGIEMNISPAGEGDMERDALAKLDIVVGSFHSQLRTKDDQTQRYIAALRNPDIQILGHPRGRRFNERLGLNAQWERVFAEAAALDKAVEVDSYPDRQDLDVERLRIARESGCRISIDTDAHDPPQLPWIELGLAAALEAGIPRERIINFKTLDEVKSWVASVRGG